MKIHRKLLQMTTGQRAMLGAEILKEQRKAEDAKKLDVTQLELNDANDANLRKETER